MSATKIQYAHLWRLVSQQGRGLITLPSCAEGGVVYYHLRNVLEWLVFRGSRHLREERLGPQQHRRQVNRARQTALRVHAALEAAGKRGLWERARSCTERRIDGKRVPSFCIHIPALRGVVRDLASDSKRTRSLFARETEGMLHVCDELAEYELMLKQVGWVACGRGEIFIGEEPEPAVLPAGETAPELLELYRFVQFSAGKIVEATQGVDWPDPNDAHDSTNGTGEFFASQADFERLTRAPWTTREYREEKGFREADFVEGRASLAQRALWGPVDPRGFIPPPTPDCDFEDERKRLEAQIEHNSVLLDHFNLGRHVCYLELVECPGL